MPALPGPTQRWRCTLCGNLTRFDVERRTRTREYVHLDLAGEPVVAEREVVEEDVTSVRCRWCRSEDVAVVDRPDAAAPGASGGRGAA